MKKFKCDYCESRKSSKNNKLPEDWDVDYDNMIKMQDKGFTGFFDYMNWRPSILCKKCCLVRNIIK
jgi:hypothetical protein